MYKKFTLFTSFLFTVLASCTPTSLSSLSNNSVASSSLTEDLTSASTTASSLIVSSSFEQVSSIASSSSEQSSSSLPPEESSNNEQSSSASLPKIQSRWAELLKVDEQLYVEQPVTLTDNLSRVGIETSFAIFNRNTNEFYGLVYEAHVRGFAGMIRFRVGIVEQKFAGFIVVSNIEHTTFGRLLLNTLTNNLPGKPATFEAVIQTWTTASQFRTGISGTYNGVMPAIEAMTFHAPNWEVQHD